MKAIQSLILAFVAFGSSGCVAMLGDSYSGYTGYTTDKGRCAHTIETLPQPDGSTKTMRTTVCKPEGR